MLTYRIANASPRRFLIADSVGLGKTIETALIERELASRGEGMNLQFARRQAVPGRVERPDPATNATTIGLTPNGERSRHLERLDDSLLHLEPKDAACLTAARRFALVRTVVPDRIHRDLAHAGILTDGAAFSATLLAWIEVG